MEEEEHLTARTGKYAAVCEDLFKVSLVHLNNIKQLLI